MFENLDQERQIRIINAALQEFSVKGFNHASTNEIAKSAGLSKALMFHYVNSKKDLFLFLYDYVLKIIIEDFFGSINLNERDMLERCKQIAFVKMELLHKYPQLFDFFKVAIYTESDQVKGELAQKSKDFREVNFQRLFEGIDETKFRTDIDVKKAKDLIIWSLDGYANKLQDKVKDLEWDGIDYDGIMMECNAYFQVIKQCFYK
jgi:TetR/AcrR family transcriptional regulator